MMTLGILLFLMVVCHIFLVVLLLEIVAFLTVILLSLRLNNEPIKIKFAFLYLVINGVLSVPMLIGAVWLYNSTDNLTFTSVSFMLTDLNSTNINSIITTQSGLYLFFITFIFKLAAAPLAV